MADESQRSDSLERRVASLEATVRQLAAELERQRGQGGHAPPDPAPSDAPRASLPHPMAPRSPLAVAHDLRQHWLPKHVDLESLIGRYGTLVLATVSALAAVGTFLGWAIANGLLGPSQRIALGLTVAAGLAVGGLRLRRRERSFGASLLGLSLAIVHVCAWGAGPSLHLVPEWGAFLLAAVVAIALAVFAHREDDEPLWSVGFSGAAIAPFVTSSGGGHLLLLAAYGVAVMSASGYAMDARRWIVAGRLFLLAAALYTAALATGFESELGPLLATGFPLVVAILGVVPWIAGLARRDRLRALGALAAVAAVRSALGMNLPLDHRTVATLIAVAGLVWLVLVDRTHLAAGAAPATGRRLIEGDWLDAGVLPMGFVASAVMALDASARGSGWAMAAAAAILLLTVMRHPRGHLRDAAAFAVVLCALIALLLLEHHQPRLFAGSVAVVSAACFLADKAWPSVSWPTLGSLGLAWSALSAVSQLTERPSYRYVPFGTEQTAVAATVLACLLLARRLANPATRQRSMLGAGALLFAFLWVHQEIAFAVNPTVAMLLRVTYYAATSVAAVGVGRTRGVALLRHVGLALAVLAAGTALYGARKLDAIAARIGADLVAAVFLLAIAYWYRRPGGQPAPAPARQPA